MGEPDGPSIGGLSGSGADFMVNSSVKDFVFDLHDATRRARMADEVRRLYVVEFRELCDKYFDKAAWPDADAVSSQCIGDDGKTPDALFLAVYREMTYRHLFAVTKPSVEDRIAVWTIYTDLFDRLIAADDVETLLVPEWTFDILHEFVYQFQSFCQYRTQVSSREPAELEALAAAPTAWAAPSVYRYLERLVRCGAVRKSAGKAAAPSELHHQAGYFALCALARLDVLVGDYGGAVAAVAAGDIDLADEGEPFARVLTCRLNLFYHHGFALLMLRRPRDAAAAFAAALSHVARLDKAGVLGSIPGGDQAKKMSDRMLALLSIAIVLAPAQRRRLDDGTLGSLREKYGDKLALMERGDLATFDEMLTFACPKFIVPSVPDFGKPVNSSFEAFRLQTRLFNEEVAQHKNVSRIRSYLKLYTSIDLEKLAKFNDMTADEFRTELVAIKHKSNNGGAAAATVGGAGAGPEDADAPATVASLDVHYYVEGDMIHIDEPEKEQRHEAYFIGQIAKIGDVVADIERLPAKAVKP